MMGPWEAIIVPTQAFKMTPPEQPQQTCGGKSMYRFVWWMTSLEE